MHDLFSYSLSQFVMVSDEVLQDLHARYLDFLWPYTLILFALNFSVFFAKFRRLFFLYLSLMWLGLAAVYFKTYFVEIHTFANVMFFLCCVQALLLYVLKVFLSPISLNSASQLGSAREDKNSSHFTRDYFYRKLFKQSYVGRSYVSATGLLIFLVSAFVPFSFYVPKTEKLIFLFGWGIDQTALGMLALLCIFYRSKWDLLLVPIPLLWLGFSLLLL